MASTSLHSPERAARLLKDRLCIVLICTLLALILAAGCTGTPPLTPSTGASPTTSPAFQPVPGNVTPHVELVYFHPLSAGCESCGIAGELVNATASTYFAPELASGRLVYRDVTLGPQENREIAERYGAYSDAVMIGVYNRSGFSRTEVTEVWFFLYNQEQFMLSLKGALDRALATVP